MTDSAPAPSGRDYVRTLRPAPPPTPSLRDEVGELEAAAFHGIAGEWVHAADPYTEADPAGVLLSYLVAAGSMIGPTPHFHTAGSRHPLNEYGVLIGDTSIGRKGEALEVGLRPAREADLEWGLCVASGFGSGEALIRRLKDPGAGEDPTDRRLFQAEHEFGNVLKVASREGAILGGVLRNAWDARPLENHTVQGGRIRATGTHVSAVAAITPGELRRLLTEDSQSNGFANRFLYFWVEASKALPFGGGIPLTIVEEHRRRLAVAAEKARRITTEIGVAPGARELWAHAYEHVLRIARPGLVGSLTGRAEVHTRRLATLYAVIDGLPAVELVHVQAALAVWRYNEATLRALFGEATGDGVKDKILGLLRNGPKSLTELHDGFSRHVNQDALHRTLQALEDGGVIRGHSVPTGGRTATFYELVKDSPRAA